MHGKLSPPPRRTNGHIRFTSNVLRSLGIVNDIACFVCAYVLAMIAYDLTIGYYYDARLHRTGAIILCINYFLIRVSRDGYAVVKGQGEDVGFSSLADFLLASGLTTLVILQLEMMSDYSRGFALYFIGFSMIALFLSRILFRKLISKLMDRGVVGQRVAIYADSAKGADKVAKLLEIERLPHLRIIGYADDRRQIKPEERELSYLGGFDALLQLARTGQLDQVILALPQIRQDRLEYIADTLSAASIDLCVLPRETLELKTGYRVNFLGSLPVFAIWQQPIRDVDGIVKEVLDRGLAAVAVVLLSPILLLTCLAIRLESKGPILFRQKRFGFNNNEISVLKFRSMYVDRQDSSGAERTQKNDPRVTRVGRFIRRTSIDELPQLFNVLKGDMSLVGPRPHATMMRVGDKYYFDAVKGYTARHRVKPGITGLAQVRGLRGEIATTERARKRVEYDVYYIENWSPLLDIRIMIETVLKLIWDKNAY
ncbi:MAG TPA: undecaprenyl-phosphate glucose phosphotransferase [Sphingopyxis sp.]|jgi:Undecaprenyl-phosphate glucose phosphotransferase|uniref:undecaprenyl-phosphate glucose phosphotransferase n=1 Tax=Sphingopyxis sp. TaxID=1908224 RepID=UPI002E126974|nr:undecaprenyl-phosphate glucose phosphotransferase [Sphingopyxis sp.]